MPYYSELITWTRAQWISHSEEERMASLPRKTSQGTGGYQGREAGGARGGRTLMRVLGSQVQEVGSQWQRCTMAPAKRKRSLFYWTDVFQRLKPSAPVASGGMIKGQTRWSVPESWKGVKNMSLSGTEIYKSTGKCLKRFRAWALPSALQRPQGRRQPLDSSRVESCPKSPPGQSQQRSQLKKLSKILCAKKPLKRKILKWHFHTLPYTDEQIRLTACNNTLRPKT